MITTIRKRREEPPADVIDLLFACHERIRRLSRLAQRLTGAHGSPLGEVQEAAGSLLRYFRHALPLHVADEDLTIRPRLHEIELDAEVRDALERMSSEHVSIDGLLASLMPCWERLASDGSLLGEMPQGWVEDSRMLREQLDSHLAMEEETIFPALRRYLSADSEWVIWREIRERRSKSSNEVQLADEPGT
ncbi:MAG: hemerythrin domain-containing protein [Deltaproteobacteria bacterium]|nr:hemerythrin domain-containing protein [Deltaproteobacteria bacterium]